MDKRITEPKIISGANWDRWTYTEDDFSWTVDIEKGKRVILKAHSISGKCPVCKTYVIDGSPCDNLDDEKVLRDYRLGRLVQLFKPNNVERPKNVKRSNDVERPNDVEHD